MEVHQFTTSKWKLLFWIRSFYCVSYKVGWGVERVRKQWPDLSPADPFHWFSPCRFPLSSLYLRLWAQIITPPRGPCCMIYSCALCQHECYFANLEEKICSLFTSSWNFFWPIKTFHLNSSNVMRRILFSLTYQQCLLIPSIFTPFLSNFNRTEWDPLQIQKMTLKGNEKMVLPIPRVRRGCFQVL